MSHPEITCDVGKKEALENFNSTMAIILERLGMPIPKQVCLCKAQCLCCHSNGIVITLQFGYETYPIVELRTL